MRSHIAGPFERGAVLADRLRRGQSLTARQIRDEFGVSWATAKRDLVELTRVLAPDLEEVPLQGYSRRHVISHPKRART